MLELILIIILFFTGLINENLINQIQDEIDLVAKSYDSYSKIEIYDLELYKQL